MTNSYQRFINSIPMTEQANTITSTKSKSSEGIGMSNSIDFRLNVKIQVKIKITSLHHLLVQFQRLVSRNGD